MKQVNHHPWHYIGGWVIWAIWFVVVYGGLSIACQINPPNPDEGVFNWINISLACFTLVVIVFLSGCALKSWKLQQEAIPQAKFPLQIATAIYAFATFGTLLVGGAILMVTPCL
ncbi:hypothetical protein OPS25_05050 [Alteromonas ponticola]|uniref:Uncharacterized protein n=1 Tax=Alteromonas aquimaris TaxID=2998417 RepID=A0ABT3P523_9ALTE|nr:hypothetical protein [Alteromonas aquimaris]MCW8107864.1 hypothetical protein [Alteromonas aquimaris]